MSHTPGPWHQSHRHCGCGMYNTQVYTADGETIATLHWYPKPKDENGSIGTYREANARLIAAAPDLLEALEEIVTISDRDHDAWERARAAVAKAKGAA